MLGSERRGCLEWAAGGNLPSTWVGLGKKGGGGGPTPNAAINSLPSAPHVGGCCCCCDGGCSCSCGWYGRGCHAVR